MRNGDFPIHPVEIKGRGYYEGSTKQLFGLTKREYFAAMAMQGILSNPNATYYEGNSPGAYVPEMVAKDAIRHADELLKQLGS